MSTIKEQAAPFGVLYADPPWEYRHKVTGRGGRGAASHHYKTLTLKEICEFPLPDISKDAFLWLWLTNPIMSEGWHVDVCKAWGFKPQSILTWVKTGIGMGYTLRSATEHLLVARRGKPKVKDHSISTWFSAPRLRHSEKPEKAREIIEKICDGPFAELFARRSIAGWVCTGNELGSGA